MFSSNWLRPYQMLVNVTILLYTVSYHGPCLSHNITPACSLILTCLRTLSLVNTAITRHRISYARGSFDFVRENEDPPDISVGFGVCAAEFVHNSPLPPCPVLPFPALYCPVLSCTVLPCLVLYCLPCPVLYSTVLSCPALSWLGLT